MLSRRNFALTAIAGLSAHATGLAQVRNTPRYSGELILRPLRDGRLMEVQQAFGYIDRAGRAWNVPAKAVVDGASIPRVLWPIVGGPWEGRYREASVVHDWFCAVRTMPWQQVHRMFHEAMLTSNVTPRVARLMFLAVRYAGPSWDELTMLNARILTRNGTVRLNPPGLRSSVNGFSSAAEEAEARAGLLDQFNALASEAERGGLSAEAMEALVDGMGRADNVAAMLED